MIETATELDLCSGCMCGKLSVSKFPTYHRGTTKTDMVFKLFTQIDERLF